MAGIPEFIESLRAAGFGLVFLWLLTLSIVYGLLSHVGGGLPKSATARGIISISAAFLVLLAASGPATAAFLSNLVSSLVMIAFGLLITVIFLEIAGVRLEDKSIFAHKDFAGIFGVLIIILAVLIFVALGGLNVVGLSQLSISGDVLAIVLFIFVAIAAIMVLYGETKGGKP